MLLSLAVIGIGCATQPAQKTPLRELYTPRFPPPPPDEAAQVSLGKLFERAPSVDAPRRSALLPSQAGVLWLSLVVVVAFAFDFRNLRNPQNVDLLLLQALGWVFFDILGFLDRLQDPTTRNIMDWVFAAVVILTLALAVRAVARAVSARRSRLTWTPAFPKQAIAAVAVLFLALDVATALYSPPDDAGYFINIGGQRLRERLRWPYGDPLLTGTPAAAYGPVLYAAHVPFQLALSPAPVNETSPPRPLIESGQPYYLPPLLATKLCTIAFHLLGVAALFAAARRLSGAVVAWTLVALYCSSPFVLGVGGGDYSIGGITFASHIAPAGLTLLAFALLPSPAWSGAALAAAIGALFYPVFMIPAWVGYYWGHSARLKRFAWGFTLTAALIGISVLAMSRPANGRSRVGTILYDTVGHQESPEAYGSSPFGFWGQRTGVRGWLMTPLWRTESMTRPVVLVFFAFAASTWFLARGATPAHLALIIAAVAMGAQMWKIHATGTYVAWYAPFLLVGVLCSRDDATDSPTPHA
jgi:hypothetical protein